MDGGIKLCNFHISFFYKFFLHLQKESVNISYVVSLKKLSEMQGGAKSWQSVQFVKRVYITEIMSAILIEDLIEFGNQTSNV